MDDIYLIEGINLHLEVKDKKELFEKMAKKMEEYGCIKNKSTYIKALKKREKEGVTGFGQGIAIPHGKSKTVIKPTVLFCRLEKPIKYESLEGDTVSKVFMIAVPENSSNEHLKIISSLARKMTHKSFMDGLDKLEHNEDFIRLLEGEE